MSDNVMIVVLGPCGAGKTTIARAVATKYKLPLISRDIIKETLFNILGWSDREWSQKLGRASYKLLYFCADKLLAAGSTFIIESNFDFLSLAKEITELRKCYDFRVILIRCFAERQTLFERAIKRDESGERHPGHIYSTNHEEYRTMLLENEIEFMDLERDHTAINADVIEVDTTCFGEEVFEHVYASLGKALRSA